jgi:hypothetical protein
MSQTVISDDTNEMIDRDQNDPVETVTMSSFDHEGNIILSGETRNSDIYIGKFSSNGTVLWEHNLNGSGLDKIEHLVIDSDNNIIVLGTTESSDFLVLNAFQENYMGGVELFITKFNSESGDIMWSTFLGGSGEEAIQNWATGISLDSANNLIISGHTGSNDFFIKNAEFQINKGGVREEPHKDGDMFITKISSTGDPIFSTYLGGSETEWGYAQIDHSDNIIFGGGTWSSDFPTTIGTFQTEWKGGNDGYISKFSPTGELLWSTLVGGNSYDKSWQFLIDKQDNIIYTAASESDDYPTTPNAYQSNYGGGSDDLVITKFDPNGMVLWSSYYGGSDADGYFHCCAPNGDDLNLNLNSEFHLDQNDNIIFNGASSSSDFPTVNAFVDSNPDTQENAYVAKFYSNGTPEFSTFLAGSGVTDRINDLDVDLENNIYAIGSTSSEDFPVANAYQPQKQLKSDAFVSKISSSGELLWSTYLGGDDSDQAKKSFIDQEGNIIVLGTTRSSNFPNTQEISRFDGSFDLFLVKFNANGELLWSRYVGGNGSEDINRFSLIGHDTGTTIIVGTTSSSDLMSGHVPQDEGDIGFFVGVDSNGELDWSTYLGHTNEVQKPSNRRLLLITGSILLGITLFLGNLYWSSRVKESQLLTDRMRNELVPLFGPSPSLIYLFNGQKVIKDNDLQANLEDEIPQEIFDFKFLLQPVRLSIVKLMSSNISLTTAEIRERLGVTWKELNYQINILKKKGYIHLEKQFVDGNIKTVVRAEKLALSDYEDLKQILLQFLDESTNIERYLVYTEKVKDRKSHDDLYPSEKW